MGSIPAQAGLASSSSIADGSTAAGSGKGSQGGGTTVVGADVGGTKIAAALLDGGHGVAHRVWVEHRARSWPELLGALESAVGQCRNVADGLGTSVAALGVAVAGWLSRDRERLVWGANLGARDQAIGPELRRRFGLPVVIENDGNATAVAEHRAAGTDPRCLVLLTLGTGVGGGVVVDGAPLVGGAGLAGELGHLLVAEQGARCVCGGRGCLELAASGPGIARAAGRATSSEVVGLAAAGDPRARWALESAGRAIGVAVARLIPVVDPDLVVLGGSLAHSAADYLLPAARSELERDRPLREVHPAPHLVLGLLGPEAGALGAAELALDSLASPRRPGEPQRAPQVL
ncbi:MAG: ROK family protein [Acidimicrobiales bacterium]